MNLKDDIVLNFGPSGKYSLSIPIKDIEQSKIIGRSFIEAGIVLMTYANNVTQNNTPQTIQKTFTWMTDLDEKAA